ncbi:unnamed protein product [Acanthoscelides obtectus]|uniref:Uncharacterized protein n=1 Tax=Acanthoscelides obtectus TaxID=200917 RepID=A0A9P0Q6B6_ACAOB|nr:unnamed protein product [Acanthoscelides obtectus]CAK1656064.1 hypothetical protein AOBTE_LOCUS19556 [Acanthoscelides obtectus]
MNNNADILPPSKVKPNSIFIFDDAMAENQTSILGYFSMGRHKGVDCFYCVQSYSWVPKSVIRDNANLIILFKVDNTHLSHVFSDHVAPDMTFKQFQDMCAMCWSDKHGFLVIDKDSELTSGRYRKGFDSFINPLED